MRIDLLGAFSSQLHIFVAFAAIEYENSCGGSPVRPVVGVGRLSILFVCGSVCLPVCECGMPQHSEKNIHIAIARRMCPPTK